MNILATQWFRPVILCSAPRLVNWNFFSRSDYRFYHNKTENTIIQSENMPKNEIVPSSAEFTASNSPLLLAEEICSAIGESLNGDKNNKFIKERISNALNLFESLAKKRETVDVVDLCSFSTFIICMEALYMAIKFLRIKPKYPSGTEYNDDIIQTYRSPYFTEEFSTFCGEWIERFINGDSISQLSAVECLDLLKKLTYIHLGNSRPLNILCTRLASKEGVAELSEDGKSIKLVVLALHQISLCQVRCAVVKPGLSPILSAIERATSLTSEQVLLVLSALVRFREDRVLEVVRFLTRRESDFVSHYTTTDLIFALRACALLHNVVEFFAASTLRTIAARADKMTSTELSTVAHLMCIMKGSKRSSHLIQNTCSSESRSIISPILHRTRELQGTFSIKEAKYVMEYLDAFAVRHSIVFTNLLNNPNYF